MTKHFMYAEPGEDGEALWTHMTEDEVMQEYWPWWFQRMKELGREELATKDRCLEDFATVHWAEVYDD